MNSLNDLLNLKDTLLRLKDQKGAEIVQDAMRWRALMASQRMHYMGSAGIKIESPMGSGARGHWKAVVDRSRDYMHFGMEFWSKHPAHNDPKYPDKFERDLLTLYVDEIIAMNDEVPGRSSI